MGTKSFNLIGVAAGQATITASDGTPRNTVISVVECSPVWNISPAAGQTLNAMQGGDVRILIGYDEDTIGYPDDFVLTSDAPGHFSSGMIDGFGGEITIEATCDDTRTVHATLEFSDRYSSEQTTYSISFTVAFYAYSSNCVDPTTGDTITALDFSQGDITAEFVFSTDMPYETIEFRPAINGFVYSPDKSEVEVDEIIYTNLQTTGSHGGFLFKMEVNEDSHPISYGTLEYSGSVRLDNQLSVSLKIFNDIPFTITGQFE